jgi:hypothetical protein
VFPGGGGVHGACAAAGLFPGMASRRLWMGLQLLLHRVLQPLLQRDRGRGLHVDWAGFFERGGFGGDRSWGSGVVCNMFRSTGVGSTPAEGGILCAGAGWGVDGST